MKNPFRLTILLVFLLQLGFLSYEVPRVLISNSGLTREIKLSLVVAGIALGILFFTKDRDGTSGKPDEPHRK